MSFENSLYREYSMYFPEYADNTLRSHQVNRWDLIVSLIDGRRFLYNGLEHSIGEIPATEDISEEQFRREFSRRLSRMLYERTMTQYDLSKLTGISAVSISKYISRKATPSFYNVRRIARALDCSVEELNPCWDWEE